MLNHSSSDLHQDNSAAHLRDLAVKFQELRFLLASCSDIFL